MALKHRRDGVNMSEYTEQEGGWRVAITEDRSCIPCILAANDDDLGGVQINRHDKMMSIYNYSIITEAECEAEGNHV